jgi:hypothetical protein
MMLQRLCVWMVTNPRHVNVNLDFGELIATSRAGIAWQDVFLRMALALPDARLGSVVRRVASHVPTRTLVQTVSICVDIVLMIQPALLKMVFAQRDVIQDICFQIAFVH